MKKHAFTYRNERPWPNPRLKRAAIVGHTTPDTARIWFRTGAPGEFKVLFCKEAEDPEKAIFGSLGEVPFLCGPDNLPAEVRTKDFVVANYSSDTTAVVDIDALEPGVGYFYALWGRDEGGAGDRVLLGHDRRHRFATIPADAEEVAFGMLSCHMPYTKDASDDLAVENMEMWGRLNTVMKRHHEKKKRPAFLIAGGDQAYTDGVDKLNIWNHLNEVMHKDAAGILHPDQDTMVSWFRDIYRGYWGFAQLRRLYSNYPTYMIWDDHELGDGWGSRFWGPCDWKPGAKDEIGDKNVLPQWQKPEKNLVRTDCAELMQRMGAAAKQVYDEYQHSHNPPTPTPEQRDYAFVQGPCAFYVLDGRGHRDVNRPAPHILGTEQMERFRAWAADVRTANTPFAFVVTAVPVLHMESWMAGLLGWSKAVADMAENVADDLRDAWEDKMHGEERAALYDVLFDLAGRNVKVGILSGDVHTTAAFRLERGGRRIWQLTSSPITYHKSRIAAAILQGSVADDGETEEGVRFERRSFYSGPNFALVKANGHTGEAVFQIYGAQGIEGRDGGGVKPVNHSIAKIELFPRD